MLPVVRVAQYATGMIDEPQCFFYVALTVTRLGVVLAYQAAKRCPHILIGCGGGNAERFVQRGFHFCTGGPKGENFVTLEYSWKCAVIASRTRPQRASAGEKRGLCRAEQAPSATP